jgi:histidine phosphotransferase ChpT
MTRAIDLRVVALLTARLCHELIGPVAAIGNGIELLAEEEEFARDAVALIGDSAKKANARLQFYRFAYGFGGGGLTGPAPYLLAEGFFAETAIACDYGTDLRVLTLDRQKLACAMLAMAGDALPRGGRIVATAGAAGPEIAATGQGAGPSAELRAALALAAAPEALTSRTVAGYFAGLLAAAQGLRLVVADQPGGFRLTAVA